ncbi:MAG: PAS domain S-box protein, partial [Desulfobulbaceae bacterium]|nr:PAS domain S-box protein [Desulfobulbaceae bacterium]
MNRISAVCRERHDPYKMIELAVIELQNIFSVDCAWLLYPCVVSVESCVIRFSATRPGKNSPFAHKEILQVDEPMRILFARLLASGQPIVYRKGSVHDTLDVFAERYGIKSQMAMVMRMRNQSPWVIGLHEYDACRSWSEVEVKLFHCAIDRISDAFDAAILYETVRNDIAKRQKVDAALSLSEQRFRTLFHCSSISLCLVDYSVLRNSFGQLRMSGVVDLGDFLKSEFGIFTRTSLKIVDINNAMLALFEMASVNEFYLTRERMITASTKKAFREILCALYAGHSHFSTEVQFRTLYGTEVHAIVTVDVLPGEQSNLLLIGLTSISAQKDTERSLLESREKYRLLVETANDAIIVTDAGSGNILEVNRKAGELVGMETGRLIGMHQSELIPPEERDSYGNLLQGDAGGTFGRYEINVRHADGYNIPVEISISQTSLGGKSIVQGIFHDISKRIKLDERRRLLVTAVEQADESVIITDLDGNIEYVNPAFERISGYKFNEVAGKNPRILNSGKMQKSHYTLLWQDISSGKVWRGRLINRKKNGEIYEEEATITPVRDNDGRIQYYVAVKRDITKQVVMENQMRQSQKMQAIGVLAGGISHDFNNILTAIMGFAEVSQLRVGNDSVLSSNLAEIVKAADRAGKLIHQILTFSRETEKNVATLEVRSIAKEVLKLLRASLPANIKLIPDINVDAKVRADPTQVHQIIMNLCTNAYQALGPKGGMIRVAIETVFLGKRRGIELGNLNQGNYVCLTVEDNGRGIPVEFMDRIFEPYFTTKEKNVGSGLGLSVVHGIVNDHGGAVSVSSKPGKGAIFKVYLPEVVDEVGTVHPVEKKELIKGVGRILLVDDEVQIIMYEQKVLERAGYEVHSCTCSKNALKIFEQKRNSFDLVITDMAMPEMTGLELFQEIRKLAPDVPVIICTGYSEYISDESSKKYGID